MTDRELMQMALAGLERISAIDRCFSQRESIRLLRDRLAHPESEIKMFEQKTDLMNDEVLRVTAEGKFIWNQKADQMIAEGDYSANPALSYILKALRNSERIHASDISQECVQISDKRKHEWVGLTDEERMEIRTHSIRNMGKNFQETLCKAIEAKLKEKNT